MDIKFLKSQKGSAVLTIALVGVVVLVMFVYMILITIKSGTKSTLHSTKSTETLQVAEIGVKQIISDIHRRNAGPGVGEYTDLGPQGLANQMNDLTGGTITKIRRDYGISESTVSVVLTLIPDLNDVDGDFVTSTEPETDVENNPMYQVTSEGIVSDAGGKQYKERVVARITIINIGKYIIFNAEENPAFREGWYYDPDGENKFDGYIHCNSDLRIKCNIFVNTPYHPFKSGVYADGDAGYVIGDPLFVRNPFYFKDYTVVVAGDIKKMNYDNTGWVLCRTQANIELGDPATLNFNPYAGEPSNGASPRLGTGGAGEEVWLQGL